MNYSRLTVSFSNDKDDEQGYVKLEQKEWGESNTATAAEVISNLDSMFFGTTWTDPDCMYDSEDRSIFTEIYAYAAPTDLQFRIGTTFGFMSPVGILEDVEIDETAKFNLENYAEFNYVPFGEVVAFWSGDVYDKNGEVIEPPPSFNILGNTAYTTQKVYGTLKLQYTARRYKYNLRVTPRVDKPENSYQAVIWSAWDGGVSLLELDVPDGIEEDLQNDVDCKEPIWVVSFTHAEDEDDGPPEVEPEDVTESYDYCYWGEGYYLDEE